MPNNDQFVQTIEAIYAIGLDAEHMPEALTATSRLLGATGATFEILDKPAHRHAAFHATGVANVGRTRYIEEFAARNPRYPVALQLGSGQLIWDHQVLDEAAMARDPFYAEFLPHFGLRYFIGAILEQTPERLTSVSFQRPLKRGHVDRREIGLLTRLCPHYQRAYDLAVRLKPIADQRDVLENTLDWLADGVALLRADGSIVYVNDTLREMAQLGDGIRIVERTFEFANPAAHQRLGAALGAASRLGDSDSAITDFPVHRDGGLPTYIVSVRPLVRVETRTTHHADAKILLFVRDPLASNIATAQMLKEMFGLTSAQAHLAQALCSGKTTTAYASERCLSLNTVYSHLKHLREKTGCRSVPELIRKFGELKVPLNLNERKKSP